MKKILRIILILLVLFALFKMGQKLYNNFFNKETPKEVDQTNNINKERDFVDTKGEDNPEVVEEFFAKGISKEDYLKILNQKSNYLKETGSYKQINYNFEEHLKYSELEEIYKNLNNSDIVKVEKIGESVDNRNIYSLEIGKGEKTILFEAGLHAAEFANTLFVTKFAVDIVNNYEENDEDIISMLNSYKIVILPSVNPDGYDVATFSVEMLKNKNLFDYKNKNDIDFHYFKANPNGIDINRNFPTQNAGLFYKKYDLINSVSYKPTTERNIYYGGTTLGSEPETKTVMYWQTKFVKTTFAYISLHSSGRVVYNGKPNLSDQYNNLCSKCAKIVKNQTGYIVLGLDSEEVGQGNDGSSTDYIAELAAGFNYSSKTKRLSTTSYDSKTEEFKHKLCVLTIETLERYTKDLGIIKDEYENYELEKTFIKLITQ